MAACDIQILFRCEHCTHADEYGRDCEHGMLFPVLLLMAGKKVCPNFKGKTLEQLQEIEQKRQNYDRIRIRQKV